MAGFALPFPSDVIGELLGVPAAHRARLLPLVRVFDSVLELGQHKLSEIRAADAAGTQLYEYFSALVTGRRAEPRDDLISELARLAAQDATALAEEELLANLVVMFNAGFRTTANLLGNGLPLLTEHPDARAALRADPDLAPAYVEEILRYDPPVHFAVRCALSDAEIAGVPVEQGQLVLVLTGAANRDPSRFADPDTFDPGPGRQPPPGLQHRSALLPRCRAGPAGGPDRLPAAARPVRRPGAGRAAARAAGADAARLRAVAGPAVQLVGASRDPGRTLRRPAFREDHAPPGLVWHRA